MDTKVKIIDVKESFLANNDADADKLRMELKTDKTFYVNVMSSPGSGKTTTLLGTLARIKDDLRAGVIEADIDSDVDAKTIMEKADIPAIQVHTGGMCHLDADMSRQGLGELGTENLDIVFLENVGNLVCPAEFDTGANLNVVILSVPEGHDKPLKYPLMFEKADVVLINKIDAAPAFNFDFDKVKEYIAMRSPKAPVFAISAATGEGMNEWCTYLTEQAVKWLEA